MARLKEDPSFMTANGQPTTSDSRTVELSLVVNLGIRALIIIIPRDSRRKRNTCRVQMLPVRECPPVCHNFNEDTYECSGAKYWI